jgi:acetolactate synthase-1/2/3 large subunit
MNSCLSNRTLFSDAEQSGADQLIRALSVAGIDTVFGRSSETLFPVFRALRAQRELRHIEIFNERDAIHAAEGYARSTGRPAAAFIGSGPGVATAVSGLLNAACDSIPLVCISGQVVSTSIGTDAFQEGDGLGLTRPVTKWSKRIRHPLEIADAVADAVFIARSGRPGPVLLEFPLDMQQLSRQLPQACGVPRKADRSAKCVHRTPPARQLSKAVDLLAAAQRPAILVGGGMSASGVAGCAALKQLSRRLDAPCASTLLGLGAFCATDSRYAGMAGANGTPEANLAVAHADVLLCVGTRLADRTLGQNVSISPWVQLIHVDIDPTTINKVIRAHVPLVGHGGEIVAALLAEMESRGMRASAHDSWWSQIGSWRARREVDPNADATLLSIAKSMEVLRKSVLENDAIVAADVGVAQTLSAQHLQFSTPMRWLTPGGLSTSDFALAAAIGARAALPDRLVICITDSETLLRNVHLLTAIGSGRDHSIKIVVLALEPSSEAFAPRVDLNVIARALGVQFRRIVDPVALGQAVAKWVQPSESEILEMTFESQRPGTADPTERNRSSPEPEAASPPAHAAALEAG